MAARTNFRAETVSLFQKDERTLLATQKWQSALSSEYSGEALFLSSTNHAQKVAT
jgi:hypothetical protein